MLCSKGQVVALLDVHHTVSDFARHMTDTDTWAAHVSKSACPAGRAVETGLKLGKLIAACGNSPYWEVGTGS